MSEKIIKHMSLTQDRLKEALSYDPETGIFTNVRSRTTAGKAGELAGGLNGGGRVKIYLDGARYYAHRLAWLYVHGYIPTLFIDHINGDPADNRICNLRECTPGENQQNMRAARSNSSTGFLGVYKVPRSHGFCAVISVDGESRRLGTFDKPEDAHQAYLRAKQELHPFQTIADLSKEQAAAVDMKRRRRNKGNKISDADAEAIRNDTRPMKEIAAQYGIDASGVSRIKNYKTRLPNPRFTGDTISTSAEVQSICVALMIDGSPYMVSVPSSRKEGLVSILERFSDGGRLNLTPAPVGFSFVPSEGFP